MNPHTAQPSNSLLQWLPLLRKEIQLKPHYNRTIFEKLLTENNLEKSNILLADLCLQVRDSMEVRVKDTLTQTAAQQLNGSCPRKDPAVLSTDTHSPGGVNMAAPFTQLTQLSAPPYWGPQPG